MNISLRFLLLFFSLVSMESVAKSPPPGIGSDIPANILIMLDTSSSMNQGVAASPLRRPADVAVDSKGNIFVSNLGDGIIKKFDKDGNFVKSWGGAWTYILRIAVGPDDKVYGTDYYGNKIRKFDIEKVWSFSVPEGLEYFIKDLKKI